MKRDRKTPTRKIPSTINFKEDNYEYLNQLIAKRETSLSAEVNRIIEHHREQEAFFNGTSK